MNTDWYLLEPVDAFYRPVSPGQPSHSVLVTNLANRVQPIIRYELGDRVTFRPEPCPCGSPFPVIEVLGCTDDILHFSRQGGGLVQVIPLALITVAEETPGVYSCQLIQTAGSTLTVRLSAANQAEEQQVWDTLCQRLSRYPAGQGVTGVAIEQAAEPPQLHPHSGKFRQVWSEVKANYLSASSLSSAGAGSR